MLKGSRQKTKGPVCPRFLQLHRQRATEPPASVVRLRTVVIQEDTAEAAIAKQSAAESKTGAGEATASFHVGAAGKIDKVEILHTTSEAHAAAVKKILAAVQVPPPPGGGLDLSQTFKFH